MVLLSRTSRRLTLAGAAVLTVVALLILSLVGSHAASADTPVGLGTAANFAVLAGATVTNAGTSTISGDLGVHPGTAVTGGPIVINGVVHAADAVALQAKNDATAAYTEAKNRPSTGSAPADLGGSILTHGVYTGATLALTGTLVLDGENDPSSVFVFQSGADLITAPNSVVVLVNGATACNVFWQVSTSATLGTNTVFAGTLLASASITAAFSTDVEGRLLAGTGQVSLDSATVVLPRCGPGTTTTVAGPTTTVAGPTTTVAGPTTTVAGPTTTVTTGPTVTETVTNAGATVTVAGPTTTVAGPTTTVAGPTTTVAGSTTTVAGPTTTVAGPTTTVAGPTTTVAGPTTTVTTGPTTTETVSGGPTTTVTASAAPVTVTAPGTTTTISAAPAGTVTVTAEGAGNGGLLTAPATETVTATVVMSVLANGETVAVQTIAPSTNAAAAGGAGPGRSTPSGLAFTGSADQTMAGTGLLLVALGAVSLVLVRRSPARTRKH